MECPKCGRGVDDGAFICPGCDYILDASFLGDDITDDEREKRPAARATSRSFGKAKPVDPDRVDFGEDAMILGNVNDVEGDGEVSSFQTRDAGVSQREATQARFYIGGAVAQLMNPDAIPEIAPGSGQSMRMTPFERHVLGFVNGKRSVGRIQKKAAMEETEFKTALALLADKGFVRLKGYKKKKDSGASSASPASPAASPSSSRPMTRSGPVPVSRAAQQPLEGERTVVASMADIEALARAPKSPSIGQAPSLSSGRPLHSRSGKATGEGPPPGQVTASRPPTQAADSFADTPVEPRPETRVAKTDEPLSPAALAARDDDGNVTRGRFASLKAADVADDDPWGKVDNASSVFADSSNGPAQKSPSLVDTPAADEPSLPPEFVEDDAGGFDDQPVTKGAPSLSSRLKDPTGIGEVLSEFDLGGGGGEPIDEDEPDDDSGGGHDDGADDEEEASFADADEDEDPAAGFVDDGQDLGPPRRIHEEVTGRLPDTVPPPPVPDDAEADEEAGVVSEPPMPTVQVPSSRPMTLPSDALMPLPDLAADAPRKPEPIRVEPRPLMPLPGQAIIAPTVPLMPLPGQGAPTPKPPEPEPTKPPDPPKPMALPGQSLMAAGSRSSAAGPLRPPTVARPSASSSVPFELRKKAERIYEQALKDQAEGRTASALMNSKLAMNFDPTVAAYKELFESLSTSPKAKPKGSQQPRELQLFEQAAEAEGRGDYERAAKLLQEAIGVNPKAAALYNRLGVVLSIRLKRHEEALAQLKKAIELEPGSIVYMNNFSKVTGLLESVLEKDPKAKKGKPGADEKVAIKKMRPVKF